MATTSKTLFRGAATTTLTTTLYTVPSATTSILTNILVSNTAASDATFDIALNNVKIAEGISVSANSLTVIDLKQVLSATETIKGGASATTVNFHISGVEIS